MNVRLSTKEILQISFLFVFLFFVYASLTFLKVSDMSAHASFAIQMSEGTRNYAGNFILYGLINVFTFCFSPIFSFVMSLPAVSKLSLSFLLAMATTYKFHWVLKHVWECETEWKRFFVALSLIFVAAIPIPSVFITGNWYLGNFMPNVWHNSTTIFLFPFAVILFAMSIKQIEKFGNRRNFWLLLFVFLNIFIKPSYFFVWVCVYPFFLFVKYGLTSKFLKGLIPVIAGLVLLFIQYLYIYHFDKVIGDESSVVIKPFQVYTIFTPLYMVPWTLLFSLLFPILYFVLNFKRLYKNNVFLFVYTSLFVAIAIFMLFMETGIRASHGNFYWQIIICSWLCFYVSLSDWLANKKQKQLEQNGNFKAKFLISVYVIHAIVGVAYLGKYLLGNYF
jgi:hypothetical protein